MQDRATRWHDIMMERAPRRRAAQRSTLGPVTTGALLTAGTLAAASTFTWMLPVTGRAPSMHSVTTPAAPTSTSQARATPAPDVLPRTMLSFASTAAHTLARWERQLDAATASELATVPQPTLAPLALVAPPASDDTTPAPASAAALPLRPTGERVVYLVDASGSLLDSLPQVIDWLGENLDGLDKHQRFTVMFFRRGEVSEAPPIGLKEASFATKAAVWTWMQPERGNVLPHGRSDLTAALASAIRYDADDIVILSDDAFNRHGSSAGRDGAVLDEVARVMQNRTARIHTVQFFYRDKAGALEAIADRFDGGYEFIQPVDQNTAATVPPLIELMIN